MTTAYLLMIAVAMTAAIGCGLFVIAARDPERYRARYLGPTLITSLATYLASGVWWASASTMRRTLAPYLLRALDRTAEGVTEGAHGIVSAAPTALLVEDVARVMDPAIMVAAASGLIGLFAWWLPELLEWLGRERRRVSRL